MDDFTLDVHENGLYFSRSDGKRLMTGASGVVRVDKRQPVDLVSTTTQLGNVVLTTRNRGKSPGAIR